MLPPLKPNCVRLYLCRHGQTHANAKRIVQGAGINSVLTPLGKTQAQFLADAFTCARVQLGSIVTSHLLRATQTAQPLVADHCIPSQSNPELREMEYGDLEGLDITKTTTQNKLRHLWQEWRRDLTTKSGQTGESMAHLIDRAANTLHNIVLESKTLSSPHIAVISHSMFLRAALAKLSLKCTTTAQSSSLNVMNRMDQIQLANSSITVVDFDTSIHEPCRPPKILLVNCTDHVPSHTTTTTTATIGMNKTMSKDASFRRRVKQLQRHLSRGHT